MERRDSTADLRLVRDEEEAGRGEDVDTTAEEEEEEEEEVEDGWEAAKVECKLVTGEGENADEVEDFGDDFGEAEEEELLLEDVVLLSKRWWWW